jgi:SAM-dependent methyltransferase
MAHESEQLSYELEALVRTKWGERCTYDSYKDVQAFFNAWAFGPDLDVPSSIDHDTDVQGTYLGPNRMCRLVLPHLRPQTEIIDICCGTGLSGKPFIEHGHQVTGYDISEKMLEKAKAAGYKETFAGNLLLDDLPWRDAYGALISVGALGEWVPPEDVVPKLLPLLKRSGALFGVTSEIEHTDLKAVLKILKAGGFQIISSRPGPGLRHPEYPPEDYYYILARR